MFRKFAVMAACFAIFGISVAAFGTIMERSTSGREVVNHTKPVYPELTNRKNVQGTVMLKVLVAADGKVKTVTPASGNRIPCQAVQAAPRQ